MTEDNDTLLDLLCAVLGPSRIMMIDAGFWPCLSEKEADLIEKLVKTSIACRMETSNACARILYRLFLALWVRGVMTEPPSMKIKHSETHKR